MPVEGRDAAAWVRESFAEFNRVTRSADGGALMAFLRDLYTEDARIDWTETTVDSGSLTGPAGVKAFVDDARGALGSVSFEPIEIVELSEDALALRVRVSARGGSTGLDVETEIAYLNRLASDGRICASKTYRSLDEAMAAYRAG